MRNRVMRTIVFFDLPNLYHRDKKNYILFRKFLLNEGFLMMQESVYSKIVLNSQQAQLLMDRLKKNTPKKGLIQVLTITERQYAQIVFLVGKQESNIIDTEDRLVVL